MPYGNLSMRRRVRERCTSYSVRLQDALERLDPSFLPQDILFSWRPENSFVERREFRHHGRRFTRQTAVTAHPHITSPPSAQHASPRIHQHNVTLPARTERHLGWHVLRDLFVIQNGQPARLHITRRKLARELRTVSSDTFFQRATP